MKVEVIMPQMGESVAEGTIIKWWKKPGDTIERDETLFEISTDKVDTEIPSPDAGVLVEILHGEGETVAINTVIAYIETEAGKAEVKEAPAKPEKKPEPEAKPEPEKAPVAAAPVPEKKPEQAPPAAEQPQQPKGEKAGFFSPVVMRIASQEGIPMEALNSLQGTGIGGRVTKKDVLSNLEKLKGFTGAPAAAPAAQPAAAAKPAATAKPAVDYGREGFSVVPMSNMRQKIAEHMVFSSHTSPHVTTVTEVDLTEMVRYRTKENPAFQQREGLKLTYTALIARGIIKAILEFPEFNASIDGTNIIYKKHINLGVAVAIENGLIVPVIKKAEEMNLTGLARALDDISSRARSKKLKPEDVQDSTISVTNPGIYGTLFGTPIINQPNVAIIGLGAIKKRPVVLNDAIAIRDMMFVSATYDHRLIDGAKAAQFLQTLAGYLEDVKELL